MFRVGIIALLIFAGYELGLHRGRHEPLVITAGPAGGDSFRLGPFLRCKQQYEADEYPMQQAKLYLYQH